MRVVAGLPKDLPAAVLLVLHMPAAFTRQFTIQLAEVSRLPVKEAESHEAPQPGVIYLCPGSHHLRISSTGKIALDGGPRIEGYRPCADVALESVAAFARALTVAVVLTGMGNDASKGVQAVKAAGGHVIVQDEATSVIFGMPAEAIKTGSVDEILPLDQISAAIEKRVAKITRLASRGCAMKIATQDAAKSRRSRSTEAVILFCIGDANLRHRRRRRPGNSQHGQPGHRRRRNGTRRSSQSSPPRRTQPSHLLRRQRLRAFRPARHAPHSRPDLAPNSHRRCWSTPSNEWRTSPAVYALPQAFHGEERQWYRGLTYLEDRVIPVIKPDGFLTPEEFARLDRAAKSIAARHEIEGAVQA